MLFLPDVYRINTGRKRMIVFQFFQECPNSKVTLENLLRAVDALQIPRSEIEIIEANTIEEAEETNFQGSSIRTESLLISTSLAGSTHLILNKWDYPAL